MVRSVKFGTYDSKTMFYQPPQLPPKSMPKENCVPLDKKSLPLFIICPTIAMCLAYLMLLELIALLMHVK
jgi:hypothetical protein